jgi:hypothetical protein
VGDMHPGAAIHFRRVLPGQNGDTHAESR